MRLSVEKLQESGDLVKLGGNLSLAELLFCGGFFLVYLVEEAVHALLDRKPEGTEAALHRSVSLRRCNKSRRRRDVEKSQNDAKISPININHQDDNICSNFGQETGQLFATRNSAYEKNGNRLDSANSVNGNSCPCNVVTERTRNSFGNTTPLTQNDNYLTENHQIVDAIDAKSIPLGLHSNQSASSSGSSASTVVQSQNASVRGLLTVIALSFHAVFEGLAVGLEPSTSSVIYLAAAIATHKLVIAFCVGMEMVAAGANAKIVLGYLAVFSAVTPLGIGIGIVLGYFEDGNDGLGPVPALLQGTAAGTLLYVVFFEVLARERANKKSGLLQLAAIVLGFMLMLGLQLASESRVKI